MKKGILYLVMALLFFMGCTPQLETETGEKLSPEFSKLFQAVSISKTFYEQSRELIKDGANQGIIPESKKDQVIEAAKMYKETHNAAQRAVRTWYSATIADEDYNVDYAMRMLVEVTDQGRLLTKIVDRVSDGEISLPENMLPSIMHVARIVLDVTKSQGE